MDVKSVVVVKPHENPVIEMLLQKLENGIEFEAVDMPKCEKKWYIDENGEYRRIDAV